MDYEIEKSRLALDPEPNQMTHVNYLRKRGEQNRAKKGADRELWNAAVLDGRVTSATVSVLRLQDSLKELKNRPPPRKKQDYQNLKYWIKTEERLLKRKIKLLERGYL